MPVNDEGGAPNRTGAQDVSPDVTSPSRARRTLLAGAAALALVLLVLSPSFGRAEPTGAYRPDLPPDALTNGCWPLPGGAVLDFGYQVRTDDVVDTAAGPRRVLVLHYDEISGAVAQSRARAVFAAAGVDDVRFRVQDFSGTAPDGVVRGEMVLDLPPSQPEGRQECQQPFSTKRFTPDMEDRS